MNFFQRVIINYYKTKLNTLGAVSPAKAAEAAFKLFCTPYHGKPKREAPPVFHKAAKISFVFKTYTIRGFHWTPLQPVGKKVLICHGFDSCHGISDGTTINSLLYRDLIIEINTLYGSFDSIIAHSLGGLATSLVAEKLQLTQTKLVLIAPAVEAVTATEHFFSLIPLQEKIRTVFYKHIESLGGQPSTWYSVSRAVQTFATPILWFHDKKDLICPYTDTLPVQHLGLQNITFITTSGLGHSKIYRNAQVQKQVVDFISAKHS